MNGRERKHRARDERGATRRHREQGTVQANISTSVQPPFAHSLLSSIYSLEHCFINMASRATRQFQVWMPNFPLLMVSARNATPTHPAFAIFRTPPKMTKHEIKEYLTKIYDLPVKKVNTMNYLGEFELDETCNRALEACPPSAWSV